MIRIYSDTETVIDEPLSIYVAQDGLYVSAALFDRGQEFDVTPYSRVMAILNLDKTVAVADIVPVVGSVSNILVGTFPAASFTSLAEGYYFVRVRLTLASVPSTFKLAKIKILKVA